MSSPEAILATLRQHLRKNGITYKMLAARIGMSESSIKRLFGQHDMPLSRLAGLCQAAGLSLEALLREVLEQSPAPEHLSAAQERALVADPQLMLVAVCCLGRWSAQQITDTYAISPTALVRLLVRLDRLGLIELKPGNEYRLRVSPTFGWLPGGAAQQFLRAAVVPDFFAGHFAADGETLQCLPLRLAPESALEAVQRIRLLCAELARMQARDQRLGARGVDGFTLLLGLRSWEFSAFTALRRPRKV